MIQSPSGRGPLDEVARGYVQLVLGIGQHDPAYVDAYYGPEQWRQEAEASRAPLSDLTLAAASLIEALGGRPPGDDGSPAVRRHAFLRGQLASALARIRMLSGEPFTFDEESAALYDAVAPTHPDSFFEATLDQLERLLPGDGPLVDRMDAFRQQFIIPKVRLASVFEAALAETRRVTHAHVTLPDDESFVIEYVTDKPWSGYNWYQGGFRSLIQLNTDLPVYIDRAIDLAAHEGYPGHHVLNVIIEQQLVRERGWIEWTVCPLFSPESLFFEGTANFGIEVAFPGEGRARFERDVLMPLAGLPVADTDRYEAAMTLVATLSYAGNEAARRYLDGQIDRATAARWLSRYALMSPARAEQRTRFMDAYRSYVINYNLGQDMVRAYVETRGGTADRPVERWRLFVALLESPLLPSALR